MKHLLFFAIVITVAASCGTKPGEAQVDGTAAPINVNSLSQPGSQASSVVTQATTPATSPLPAAPTVTASTGAVNPAHGEPGHRCELAVGAPLNSAPAATTTPSPVSTSPTITTSAPVITQSAPAKTAPGMNPPHGQPGHRCDIGVGEPLNGKPASATTTPSVTPASTPVLNPSVTPAPVVTSQPVAAKTKTAPGMNPPHGEPGHKCDIAVGAPLDSKPGPVVTNANKDSFQIKN